MEESDRLVQKPDIEPIKEVIAPKEIITEGVTPIHDVGNGYVEYNNSLYNRIALQDLKPELFRIRVDNDQSNSSNFGTSFPRMARKGDIFVRVDALPNRVFKFDGKKWLEQNKAITQTYMYNKDYIEFLIEKLNSGEYDLDVLSDDEKAEIEAYLKGNQNN